MDDIGVGKRGNSKRPIALEHRYVATHTDVQHSTRRDLMILFDL